MPSIESSGLQLPQLPSLAPEDIAAIRNSWGGKILGRTAVVLSLVLMLLGSGVAMNKELSEFLNERLFLTPWQEFALFFGIPGLYVAGQLYFEWRAARERKTLQTLAVKPVAVPQGYFRVGPYLDTPEDRAKFDRADNAHEKVLAWIIRSAGTPLYLTGDSGSGKSSLLNAFVLPSLRETGWTVVEARAWQDPEHALIQALNALPGMLRARQNEEQDLRSVIESAARRAKGPLLFVLDQFEEFLILGNSEKQKRFATLIEDLNSNPIKKLTVLLALRSDYETPFLEDIGLPDLRQGENYFKVGRFSVSAATRFMTQSDLNLQPQALEQLINSSAAMDATPGAVRPITLNIIGHVLTEGGAVAPSMDAGKLTRIYIKQAINQPAISGFAVPVLENLITEQGTKQPRSEQDLAKATKLRAGEVRGVLNALSAQALARPLDPEQGIWELSHDFVARAVSRQLGRRRRDFVARVAAYAAPAILTVALAAVAAWIVLQPLETVSGLDSFGISMKRDGAAWVGTATPYCNDDNLALAVPMLREIGAGTSMHLDFSDSGEITDLTPLAGLSGITQLNLSNTDVSDLSPLKGLTALTELNLSESYKNIKDLSPLRGLIKLKQLDLSDDFSLIDVSPLKGLTALTQLDLSRTSVADVSPLKDLTALTRLDLPSTHVSDLTPLKGFTALTQLDLSDDGAITDFLPLNGLTALTQLSLAGTSITDVSPLKSLTALTQLDLSQTSLSDVSPLESLTALTQLNLSQTNVDSLSPLKSLTALTRLDLTGDDTVTDVSPLRGVTTLRYLSLYDTRITDLSSIEDLPQLRILCTDGTPHKISNGTNPCL